MVIKNKLGFNMATLYGVSFFLLIVLIFWTKIVSLFKPKGYENEVQKPIDKLNQLFLNRYWIVSTGNFITQNGNGTISKYTIQQAQADALRLSKTMDTSKRDSWYERIFSVTFSPSSMRVKSILNPNYPSTYRRYVIQAYSDVYTDGRNLQSDVRSHLTSLSGIDEILGLGQWNQNLTKYFIL